MNAATEDQDEFMAGSDGLENFADQAKSTLRDVGEILRSMYDNREDAAKLADIVGSAAFQSAVYHCYTTLERGKLCETQ